MVDDATKSLVTAVESPSSCHLPASRMHRLVLCARIFAGDLRGHRRGHRLLFVGHICRASRKEELPHNNPSGGGERASVRCSSCRLDSRYKHVYLCYLSVAVDVGSLCSIAWAHATSAGRGLPCSLCQSLISTTDATTSSRSSSRHAPAATTVACIATELGHPDRTCAGRACVMLSMQSSMFVAITANGTTTAALSLYGIQNAAAISLPNEVPSAAGGAPQPRAPAGQQARVCGHHGRQRQPPPGGGTPQRGRRCWDHPEPEPAGRERRGAPPGEPPAAGAPFICPLTPAIFFMSGGHSYTTKSVLLLLALLRASAA